MEASSKHIVRTRFPSLLIVRARPLDRRVTGATPRNQTLPGIMTDTGHLGPGGHAKRDKNIRSNDPATPFR